MPSPSENHENQPLPHRWWGHTDGLQCKRLHGEIRQSGWQWQIHSSDAVWLWLNLHGDGLIWEKRDRIFLRPGMYAMTGGNETGDWNCVRHPGPNHLEIVVMPRKWLLSRIVSASSGLHPRLAGWLADGGPVAFCGLMGIWERDLCHALANAANSSGPTRLLAEARILEWAAARFFRTERDTTDENFSRNAGENNPVKHAIEILSERLDQPLDLALIARRVGVSRHHLSRRVTAETGIPLSHHLRRLRIERACETLDSKRMNVTEVALEVGYQSLSHFAKAFREETGRSPREWLTGNSSRPDPR